MLDSLDLKKRLSKAEYKKRAAELQESLRGLQYQAQHAGLPMIVILEGWNASGRGGVVKKLNEKLDPRLIRVFHGLPPTPLEQRYHFLRRYQVALPEDGSGVIFDISWYHQILSERCERRLKKKRWREAFRQINDLERWLTADGQTLVKFWLHISRGEQRRRFRAYRRDPLERWKLTKPYLRQHREYGRWRKALKEMLAATNTPQVPWMVVEANDLRWARVRVLETLVAHIEQALARPRGSRPGDVRPGHARAGKSAASKARLAQQHISPDAKTQTRPVIALPDRLVSSLRLNDLDLSRKVSEKEYKKEIAREQLQLRESSLELYRRQVSVLCVMEGWDAAGKGGSIKRITEYLDPRGYTVSSFAAPRGEEETHHYLWRFWGNMPRAGHLTIFDRSYYGRVLVERVEGFCKQSEWQRAYAEINEFESHQLSFGMVILKFWLHISRREQLRRFKTRQTDPFRAYKLTEEDWRNHARWEDYRKAAEEMFVRTGTPGAPWHVVPAENKHHTRVTILRALNQAIARRLG